MSTYIKNNFTKTPQGVRVIDNKNPHAVALGKMTSDAKAEAARKNGQQGGRLSGS